MVGSGTQIWKIFEEEQAHFLMAFWREAVALFLFKAFQSPCPRNYQQSRAFLVFVLLLITHYFTKNQLFMGNYDDDYDDETSEYDADEDLEMMFDEEDLEEMYEG